MILKTTKTRHNWQWFQAADLEISANLDSSGLRTSGFSLRSLIVMILDGGCRGDRLYPLIRLLSTDGSLPDESLQILFLSCIHLPESHCPEPVRFRCLLTSRGGNIGNRVKFQSFWVRCAGKEFQETCFFEFYKVALIDEPRTPHADVDKSNFEFPIFVHRKRYADKDSVLDRGTFVTSTFEQPPANIH